MTRNHELDGQGAATACWNLQFYVRPKVPKISIMYQTFLFSGKEALNMLGLDWFHLSGNHV